MIWFEATFHLTSYLPETGEKNIEDKEINHFKVGKHPEHGTNCIMIVKQDGNEVPCNRKKLAGAKTSGAKTSEAKTWQETYWIKFWCIH